MNFKNIIRAAFITLLAFLSANHADAHELSLKVVRLEGILRTVHGKSECYYEKEIFGPSKELPSLEVFRMSNSSTSDSIRFAPIDLRSLKFHFSAQDGTYTVRYQPSEGERYLGNESINVFGNSSERYFDPFECPQISLGIRESR